MRLRAPSLAVAVAAVALAGFPAPAQEPPAPQPRRPIEIFRDAREQTLDGKYDLAAEFLKDFLAANPGDQDYLDVEARYGSAAFQRLRTVPRWYEDPRKDDEFKTNTLDKILAAAQAANAKLTRDPRRIARFVQNLGGVREERDYAIAELQRSGDAAVPVIVEALRTGQDDALRSGIYTAVTRLGRETVPAFVAALDGLADEHRVGLVQALFRRPDAQAVTQRVDTDYTPHLWYFASAPGDRAGSLRATAADTLRQLYGRAYENRPAEAELVRLTEPLFTRTARFANLDAVKNTVKVWSWDAAAMNVRAAELSPRQAEERFGLRNLKWALDRRPGYDPAQQLFLALSTERAVERARFGDLARDEPAAYQLLAAAREDTLAGLLRQALAEKKAALAYGLVQVIGDRGDRGIAASPPSRQESEPRPSLLARALTFPDPRVQFAAAVALLKMPPGLVHGANARVVDVLARAAAADPGAAGPAKGVALVTDPQTVRNDRTASLLRGIGYRTEVFSTGRDLLRRVGRASDFDLIVVDRHVVVPELADVLAHLTSDPNAGRRPILVVASSDNPKPVGLETLLFRLALLIAVTETEDIGVPPPHTVDRRVTQEQNEAERLRTVSLRDRRLAELYTARLARLRRIVQAANLRTSDNLEERLALRLPQLTYAVLAAEFGLTAENAPATVRQLDLLTQSIASRQLLDSAADGVPTDTLVRLIEQLETAVTPPLRERFDALRRKIVPDDIRLAREVVADPEAEVQATRVARRFPGVKVIDEPYSRGGLADDVQTAVADPADLPPDPAARRATAKEAVEWLRRIASGGLPGYDVRPAEPALRAALRSDDTAPAAIEALIRIGTADVQRDLLTAALAPGRPVPIRRQAAEAVVRHVNAFGPLVAKPQTDQIAPAVARETLPEMRSQLAVVQGVFEGKPATLDALLMRYQPQPAAKPAGPPPPAAAQPQPAEPKKEPPPEQPKS